MKKTVKRSKRVMVVGGGIAGATVAQRLGSAGVEVHLVEKQPELGGRVRELGCKATDICMRCNVCVADEMVRSVCSVPGVHVHTSTEVRSLDRSARNDGFTVELVRAGKTGSAAASEKIEVSNVVVATGYDHFSPLENTIYGYGRVRNVVTGTEAEKQLSTVNRLARVTDGKPPKKVAFVMCVGSRTEEVFRCPDSTGYCSTVCCAYSLRLARRIKHQAKDADITVFIMDVQNFGKGFNAFFKNCKEYMKFIRARPQDITEGKDGGVKVKYAADKDGKAVSEDEFDMVILATGIRPRSDAAALGDKFGLPMDENGFFGLKGASALPALHREGIYVAGAGEAPKDIAGSMAQAEAVSTEILARLGIKGPRMRKGVAVIGGGIAGLQAAASLTGLGYPVTLIHGGKVPGGFAASTPELFGHLCGDTIESMEEARRAVERLVAGVAAGSKVKVVSEATLKTVTGGPGDFTVRVALPGGIEQDLQAGAVVLSTGFAGRPAVAYQAAGDTVRKVIGVRQAIEMTRAGSIPKRVAVVIDTTGEQGRAVTGEVLSMAELMVRKGASVRVYCSHVRVGATGLEALYKRAREAGVVVVKQTTRPVIREGDATVSVTATDAAVGAKITDECDLVVVADRRTPDASKSLAKQISRLRPGPDQAMQYDNVWLLPVETNRPGIFAAGAARGNSEYREALTDGMAVASQVHQFLGGGLKSRKDVAVVDGDKCVACLTCLRICPHGAISIDRKKNVASVSGVSCQSCGICVSECPAKALSLPGFTDDDMVAKIGNAPTVTVFACENSAIPAAEAAKVQGRKTKVDLVKVPCAGKVDPRLVLAALEKGSEKVMLLGCHPESCQYLSGSSRGAKRMKRLSELLGKAGIDGSRVVFGGISNVEPERFMEYVGEN